MKKKQTEITKSDIVHDIKSMSEITGVSEISIYVSAFILVLHNYIESTMDEFFLYLHHNPLMDDDHFQEKILGGMSFQSKIRALEKYVKKNIIKKLRKINELRNKYAHRLVDIGRTQWKQISREETDKYIDAFSDFLKDIMPKVKELRKQYFVNDELFYAAVKEDEEMRSK